MGDQAQGIGLARTGMLFFRNRGKHRGYSERLCHRMGFD